MNGLLCWLDIVVADVARVYSLILLIYAVVSWIPDLRGPWVRYLAMLVEPVLAPVRRIIPPVGGLDLAFLVVILITSWVIPQLLGMSINSVCAAAY